jgi:ubiquinone biosynthesis protein
MLQKTMVVVEGVARSLDPRLDMWTTAEPVVRAWLKHALGALREVRHVGHHVGEGQHRPAGLVGAADRASST